MSTIEEGKQDAEPDNTTFQCIEQTTTSLFDVTSVSRNVHDYKVKSKIDTKHSQVKNSLDSKNVVKTTTTM